MGIRVRCPKCGQVVDGGEAAGGVIECPGCHQRLRVPTAARKSRTSSPARSAAAAPPVAGRDSTRSSAAIALHVEAMTDVLSPAAERGVPCPDDRCGHPFIPVSVIPWMKCFWAKKKMTMTGTVISRLAAIVRAGSFSTCTLKA